jgi:hypothetical protein
MKRLLFGFEFFGCVLALSPLIAAIVARGWHKPRW